MFFLGMSKNNNGIVAESFLSCLWVKQEEWLHLR